MLRLFLESLCSSLTILMVLCFLRDIEVNPKVLIWLSAIYVLLSTTLLITEPNDSFIGRVSQLAYLLCPLLIMLIVFRVRKIKSILYTYLLYAGLMWYISYLLISVLTFLNLSETVWTVIDIAIYLIILALVSFVHRNRYRYKNLRQIELVSTKFKVMTLICFWVSAIACVFINEIMVPLERTKPVAGAFVILILMVGLMGILAPALVIYALSRSQYKILSKTYEKQANAQLARYEAMQEANADLRKFRHDYGNFHDGLKSLLRKNKIDEAIDTINSFDGTIELEDRGLYNTSNHIVDALLQDKQNRAKKSNITIKFKGFIPPEGIAMKDLCIIFGVPLDNAIEACEKMDKDKEKVISVVSEPVNSCLFIDILNPVAHDVEVVNNGIKTSKKDKTSHGIGLPSLKESLEKYDGNVEFSCNEKIFKVELSLFYR